MMEELRAAMKQLGFKSRHMTSIFTLLSAILHLGNLTFNDHNGHDATFESAHITNVATLEIVADLLAVDIDLLHQSLTQKSRFIRKEVVTSFLNVQQASAQRDALMRDLYATLFAFIIETANHKVAPPSIKGTGGKEKPSTLIVQLDTPGYQSTAGSSINGPTGAQGVPSRHEEFCTNFVAEMVQNWQTRRAFEDHLNPNAEAIADGINLPPIVAAGNTACIELLRGTVVGSVADRKPAGMLGAMDKAVHRVKSGKMTEEDDAALLAELETFAVHSSFVSSQSLYASSGNGGGAMPQLGARGRFGVNHYQGSCIYTSEHFVEQEIDAFDAGFVAMLRGSGDSFVAKLFAGPSLATESHPLDESVIVSAQVSARPLRKLTNLVSGDAESTEPLLDPTKMYGVTRQINATLSEMLNALDHAGRVWSVMCIRPNDIGQANSFDTRRVKSQVRALLIPDLVARKRAEYVAKYDLDEFCLRYSDIVIPIAVAAGAQESKGKIQAVAIANAWRDGQDYAIGNSKVWLSYLVWRKLEDRLRAMEIENSPADDELAGPNSPAYPPGSSRSRAASFASDEKAGARYGSALDVHELSKRPSNVSDPFRSPGEAPSISGGDSVWAGAALGAPIAGGWDRQAYGDVNPGMAGALEKEGDLKNKPLDQVEEEGGVTSVRRWWKRLVWMLTFYVPGPFLRWFGGLKRPDIRFAWREKLAICVIIALINGLILFIILGLGKILCPDMNKAWNESQLSAYNTGNQFYVAVAGKVYDISKFWKLDHADYASKFWPDDDTILQDFAGRDLSLYFPVPLSVGCPNLVTDTSLHLTLSPNSSDIQSQGPGQAVHTSGAQQTDKTSALAANDWYPNRFVPSMRKYYKGTYVYSKDKVSTDGSWRSWVIVNDNIYDLTDYFFTIQQAPDDRDFQFLNKDLTDLFRSQAGTDVSKDFNNIVNNLNSTARSSNLQCLNDVFYVGKVDFREEAKCLISNYLLLAFSIILVATIVTKFLAALQLTTKRNPEQQDKFVICQVPCYTEGEESLRKTIDSLAGLKYDDKRKLLFIICDGMIVGSGNDVPTPRIVLDILGVDPRVDPEPLMFKSVAEGSKQLNYGKIYSGLYEFEGHVVPYIVVVKCGRPTERARPGNRGKRDSQILLMRWLNRVHFDTAMSPLELEIYHQCKNVIGIDPAFYEYVLTVDADTRVEEDALNRLVSVAADDSRIIALCGETKLDNEEGSWWTMIQGEPF